MHRRSFLHLITAGYLLGASGCAKPQAAQPRRGKITLGPPARFQTGRSELNIERLVVLHEQDSFAAMSMVCTHQECLLRSSASGFECPCHGSGFSLTGEVRSGPAQRDLEWYELQLTTGGDLEVNFSKLVGPEWRLRL